MNQFQFSRRLVISAFLLLVSTVSVFSQSVIKGTIIDEVTKEPLSGASIYAKDEKVGAITDAKGSFGIKISKYPLRIHISFVGYKEKDIICNSSEDLLQISLAENHQVLNDIVVIGYGTQSRQNVTSAISSVKSETFKDVPVNSFDQVLQGRSSGVQLTSPSGNLGTAPIIRIRGVASITSGTSPLYVVDGIPIQSGNLSYSGDINVLSDINPDDIQSIDVLKDASAGALYGSRAANGVVLITTKKGTKGRAKVSYNGWVGISSPVKYYDVLNAEQFVDVKNEAVKNHYGTDQYSLSKSTATTDGSKAFNLGYDANGKVIDTDWNKYVFQNGIQQSHAVAVDGGNDRVQYHISTNYLDQSGILKGDKYSRLGTSFSVDAQANKWLKVGGTQTISLSNQQTADRSRGGNITAYSALSRLAWADAPNIAAYNADGTPYQEQGHLGYGPNTVQAPLDNPVAIINSKSFVNTENIRWLSNYYGELTPIKNLTLRTQYGKDFARIEDRDFHSPTTVNGYSQNGVATNVSTRSSQYTWTNTANYKLYLGHNNFDFLAGSEISERNYKYWGSTRSTLVDASYNIYEASYKNITAIDSKISESGMVSYLARVNYDYDSRYILSANYRRDGYSALSKNHRWGNFGGVSGAWRVSDEAFFKPLKNIFSDLKLKASWGVVGNTKIDDYASKSYYSSGYYGTDGTYILGQVGDSENLKWETSKKFDAGFSTLLWNNINIDFDYYRNVSSDLILQVPVSPSEGIPNNYITSNAGGMRNSGLELSISANIINKKDFTWYSSFNITTNKNVVTNLSENMSQLITAGNGESTNITMVGKSIGQLYLYPTQGIDPATGRRIFTGNDGTKVLMEYEKSNKFYTEDGTAYSQSNLSRVVAGNTLPTWYGGWANNFKYKNLDMSVLFQFSGGNKIYNGSTATLSDVRFWNNSVEYKNKYWTAERTNAKYALPIYGDNYSNGSALPITDWVENGDYVRLKNISLGYTLDQKTILKTLGLSTLRIYLQAQNLFVLTGYSGLDPEVLSQTQSPNLNGGTDHNTAPQARTFTFGAQITF